MLLMKFSSATMRLWTIGRRNFHMSKCKSLFYEDPNKEGYRIISDQEKNWEKLPYKDKLLLEWRLVIEGIKEFYDQEKKNLIRGPRFMIYDHEVDVIWKFTGDKKELKYWIITTDKDHNQGYSTAQIVHTPDLKGLFYGFLDTRIPPDGTLKQAGMCNLRAVGMFTPFKNIKKLNWSGFTHLVLRLRGDGRVYTINIHPSMYFDVNMYDIYHYFIWTRGGPYWQYVRIPFSKFFLGYKGRIPSKNDLMPLNAIKFISFTLADKITGPFRLEIDYIGIENDPSHIEETAYEDYHINAVVW